MPGDLAEDTIDVPFGLGVDNSTDDKNVIPGRLIELENGIFDKRARVSKRPGLVPFTGFGSAVGRIAADDNFLYLRDSSTSEETLRGKAGANVRTVRNAVFPRLTGAPITSPISNGATGNMQTVDLALDTVGQKLGLGVFTDTANAIGLTAIDYDTMQPIVTEVGLIGIPAGQLNARVLARGTADKFIVGVHNGGTLRIYDNVTTSGTTLITGGGSAFTIPAAVVTIAGLNATPYWDWCLVGSTLYVVYLDAAGTGLTIAKYTVGTWAATTQAIVVAAVQSVTVSANATANLAAAFWGTATNVRVATYNATTLAPVTAAFTIYAPGGSPNFEQITALVTPTRLFFNVQASMGTSPWQKTVHFAFNFNQTAAALTAITLAGVSLASKLSTDFFCACVFNTTLQRTLLFYSYVETLGTFRPDLCGRIFYGAAGDAPANKCLPSAVDFSRDGVNPDLVVACTVSQASTASATTQTRMFTMGYAEAQKPGQRAYPQAKINGRAYFGGGFLHNVSADGVIPNGFLVYPEIISLTPAAAGGSLADGVYGCAFSLEWTDEMGELHESAPSPIVTTTVSGGGGAGRIDYSVFAHVIDPTRQFATVPVFLVSYRTVAGGTHLYREKRQALSGNITPSGSLTLAAATLSQFAINASAEGAEVEAAQPDCPVAIVGDVDRMWITPGSALNTCSPSKPKLQGIGLEFFPDIYRVVSPSGDGVVALARSDGKTIAFKRSSCFIASGDGPDATGSNDSLSQFSELFPKVGAEAHNAVVASNLGVYAKDRKDIWFIGRDQQLSRIGADVENFTTLPLRAALNIEDQRMVRFLLGAEASTCTELAFDEDFQQWNVNPRAANANTRQNALVFDDTIYYYLNNAFFTENPAVFTDNGVGYSFRLLTAWLKPTGKMQGWSRIWKALLIGNSYAAHTLQVRVRYDFETAWAETHTISSVNATTGDGVWQPEVMLIRQRCSAIQFEISDITPTGQAFSLSGLELKVGVIPGTKRGRAEKRL